MARSGPDLQVRSDYSLLLSPRTPGLCCSLTSPHSFSLICILMICHYLLGFPHNLSSWGQRPHLSCAQSIQAEGVPPIPH